MTPESRFKRHIDNKFDKLFGKKSDKGYRTAIEKGAGQKSGLPDRYYSALGGCAWIESKVHPYGLSELQKVVLRRLARSGTRVVILTRYPEYGDMGVIQYQMDGHQGEEQRMPETAADNITFWATLLNGALCYSPC